MNWKPILQAGIYIAGGLLAGGGVMYGVQPPQAPQSAKSNPVSVTCEVKLPKQVLDVYVHGAEVRK